MHKIAFQGERGSFSEEAAQMVFGVDIMAVPCREFRDVGQALASGAADHAVLPVENSIAGSVLPAYDVLASTDAPVIGEVTRRIRHCVLGISGTRVETLQRIISHPVALAQCSKFFIEHPHIQAIAAYDTAGAAKEVAAAGSSEVAAIAARNAGELYHLEVIAADVQDRDDNQTRFYILGPDGVEFRIPKAGSKTALLLETDNRPGALLAVLQPFADARVNLSKLESRPGETPWTYRFFLELEGAAGDESVAAALEEVRSVASRVHVLGSFAVLAAP
jgi:prephenate dehydratase